MCLSFTTELASTEAHRGECNDPLSFILEGDAWGGLGERRLLVFDAWTVCPGRVRVPRCLCHLTLLVIDYWVRARAPVGA